MIPRRPLTGSLAVFHEIKTSCSSIKQVCCYYICFYLFIDLLKTLARVGRDRGGEVGGGGGVEGSFRLPARDIFCTSLHTVEAPAVRTAAKTVLS